jgi:hypothetical protein
VIPFPLLILRACLQPASGQKTGSKTAGSTGRLKDVPALSAAPFRPIGGPAYSEYKYSPLHTGAPHTFSFYHTPTPPSIYKHTLFLQTLSLSFVYRIEKPQQGKKTYRFFRPAETDFSPWPKSVKNPEVFF